MDNEKKNNKWFFGPMSTEKLTIDNVKAFYKSKAHKNIQKGIAVVSGLAGIFMAVSQPDLPSAAAGFFVGALGVGLQSQVALGTVVGCGSMMRASVQRGRYLLSQN